jgi:hypothetical protein
MAFHQDDIDYEASMQGAVYANGIRVDQMTRDEQAAVFGFDTDAQLQAEEAYFAKIEANADLDAMEARGGPALPEYYDLWMPW